MLLLLVQTPGFGTFAKETPPEVLPPGRMTYSGTIGNQQTFVCESPYDSEYSPELAGSQCYGTCAPDENQWDWCYTTSESSTWCWCKLQDTAQPLNLQAAAACDYANGEMFDGANCVVPTTAETPAAEECYVPGFELRWSSVMDLYNLVGHDTFTSLLTDVNTVEEAMSKFVAPAKHEMKRQCEKAKARAPPTTP